MIHPFNNDMLTSEEHELINYIYNHLSLKSDTAVTEVVDFDLNNFSLFAHYKNLQILSTIAIRRAENAFLSFIKLNYTSPGGKRGDHDNIELQLWGYAILRKDFGHVLIRSENFADKLLELVCPVEIDFDDDNLFSKQFYVVADDKDKAVSAMNFSFRNVVTQLPEGDFLIEIVKDQLIIGNRKPASIESTEQLGKFITTVALLR
ncbi:MAG: hypothetical protein ABIP28_00645 [Mucilaginibacter sp.]